MNAYAMFDLVKVNCASCGIQFGLTEDYQSRRRNDHQSFYCPSGHSNVYRGENKEEALKKEVEGLKRRLEWKDADLKATQKSRDRYHKKAAAFKGVVTKIKKRVGNGVCPCCNRTFQNLHNHMKNQHPKFKETK